MRQFTRWHIDFWHRYVPRREDGTLSEHPGSREPNASYATPLDAFLARTDEAAHEYLADCLTFEREIDLAAAPSPAIAREPEFVEAEG